MKSLLTLAFFLFLKTGFATTYYISPSGSDEAGNGSLEKPWKTLYKATSLVQKEGDVIHVNTGVYVESLQSNLRPGVSLEGTGISSILKSNITADWVAMISLRSPEGTNGKQHISNLKFDGQNLSTYWGIDIAGRSNVEVCNITMIDFKSDGILFNGAVNNLDQPPTTYATGNSFHDNIVHNCAGYNLSNGIYGRGALRIGGQEGMLVYNNTITQTERPAGYNGYCIKYSLGGFNKGLKIYNNTITKIPFTGAFDGDNGWTFCIELWHCEGGMEIYNNNFQGSLDLVQVRKRTYDFGAKIYNNNFTEPNIGTLEMGLDFEIGAESVIIENNVFDKLQQAIIIQSEVWHDVPRIWENLNVIEDITIRNNLFSNMGYGSAAAINVVGGSLENIFSLRNFNVCNNTFHTGTAKPGDVPWVGVFINLNDASGHIQSVAIQNNIFVGFPDAYLKTSNTVATFDTLIVTNNLSFCNGNNNVPSLQGVAPMHYINDQNIIANPLFISSTDFKLQPTSPCYNVSPSLNSTKNTVENIGIENNILLQHKLGNNYVLGKKENAYSNEHNNSGSISFIKTNIIIPAYYTFKNTSWLLLLALFSGLVALCFFAKEKVYGFPISLFVLIMLTYSAFINNLWGEVILNIYFIAINIYGWALWLKKDKRKHRIVRITSSSKKEIIMQLVFFILASVCIYLGLTYFKNQFADSIIWGDTLVVATAVIGTWLIINKKVESWYWLIANSAASVILYYAKHLVFTSGYYAMLFIITIWCLFQWEKRKSRKRNPIAT